jgi:hypothetical protein
MEAMEKCIKAVRAWMVTDKLKLNEGKTEFMIIGTRQQLKKVTVDQLLVGDKRVTPVSNVKDLGVWLDSHLKFDVHITKTCSTAYYFFHNIRRIRKYLTHHTAQILVHALVIGRIDYYNSLFYGLPKTQTKKLERVQNMAARLITNSPRYCHITPIVYRLHWLPIEYRIKFKILLITFKAIHDLAPDYIKDLINVKNSSAHNLRSDCRFLLAPPTFNSKKTTGDRTFVVSAPTLWNELPSDITRENNINSFKKRLKTYLFREAYANF